MADDAGFAVALVLRERLLNDGLLAAYGNESFPHSLSTPVPGGPPDASIDVFIAPPTITCNADDTLTLSVEWWGELSISESAGEEVHDIDGHLQIRIVPRFFVSGSDLVLRPNTGDVTVTSWDFTVIAGGGFSTAADTYLRSSFFRDRLESAIQFAISIGVVSFPSIDISFVGASILSVMSLTASSRVRQGAVMIGLDVDVPKGPTTHGNVDLLLDFARNNDIAAVISAAAVPLYTMDVQTEIGQEVSKHGATLNGPVVVTPDMGKFRVVGSASKSSGSVNFSFSLIPTTVAYRPGAFFRYLKRDVLVKQRSWPALGFTTAEISVDASPPIWVVVVTALGTVLVFWLPAFVAEMVSAAATEFHGDIAAGGKPPVPRVQHIPPAQPGGPTLRIAIAEYQITPLGIYVGLTLGVKAPPPKLIGLTSIPDGLRNETLRYDVRLPLGVRLDDPALRVRWTIFDLASGNILVNEDDVALDRDSFSFVPATVGPGLSKLGISCRVYRALGATLTDFVNDGITLAIRGPLPAGAYVRWHYDVKNPQVEFDADADVWAYKGEQVQRRWSNLHRTEHPFACANASKRSRYTYQTDIVDALPFAIADILENRKGLCDYCFFGGPGGLLPSL